VAPANRHNWWTRRHWAVNERIKQGDVDMIFIGDSITHSWENNGKEVWQKYYGHRKAVNLGFSGDRTQHVLWRLDNGNIDGISPKVAVIMIGTNNSNKDDNTAEEIADGIIAICKKLRAKLPKTKILLLAVFPRAEKPCPQREKIAKANKIASKITDDKMIHYLDIGPKFLQPDKSISKEIMPDYLHLTPRGYQIWAEALEPTVARFMGEKK
jgi:beta-glucosidase